MTVTADCPLALIEPLRGVLFGPDRLPRCPACHEVMDEIRPGAWDHADPTTQRDSPPARDPERESTKSVPSGGCGPSLADAARKVRTDVRNTIRMQEAQGRKADSPGLIVVVDFPELDVLLRHVEAHRTGAGRMSIDTDRHPEHNYAGENVDGKALEALARRSMSITGIPQRMHYHGAAAACNAACRLIEP